MQKPVYTYKVKNVRGRFIGENLSLEDACTLQNQHKHSVVVIDRESAKKMQEYHAWLAQEEVMLQSDDVQPLAVGKEQTYCERCSVVVVQSDEKYCAACAEDILQYLYQAEQDQLYLDEVERYAEDMAYSELANLTNGEV